MGKQGKKGSGYSKKKHHKGLIIFVIILALFGITGGALIKLGFFEKMISARYMPTDEANRLISYLGISDYEYTDRWGSSFTFEETKKLVASSKVSSDKFSVSLSDKPGFMPITREQFESVYETLIKELELERLSKQDIYIYDIDSAGNMELNGITYELIHTSAGDCYMEKDYGFPREYVGKIVSVYLSNNELILCMGESDAEVTIKNVYVSDISEENGTKIMHSYVDLKLHDFTITESFTDKVPENGYLCDVVLTNSGVVKTIDHSADLIETKVISYGDGLATVEGYEEPLFISPEFNVYKLKGTFRATRSAGTLIGYDKVSLYINDNMIEAALLTEDIHAKNIRVLISNSDYSSYYNGQVSITSDTDFTLSYGDKEEEHKAGERLLFSNGSEELKNGPAKITSKVEDGKIQITSIERQYGIPSYRGTIELSRDDKGVMIINELPVEQYLYGVVPSEMPTSYNLEALKAQAICARAYAFSQMESDNFAEYGAHLDDSIACQVYNNVPEDERAIFAVDDTYGIVPCYNNSVIEAFFFSTSCGTTSNNSSVWGGNQEPYLLDTMETGINDFADFSEEERFVEFINSKSTEDFFENEEPFFRWSVEFTKEQLTDTINSHLYERIQAMPEYILAKNSSGSFEKKNINSIGDLQSIQVTKRGDSGIIEEMLITGSSETIMVKGQANARSLLSPSAVTIRKQDGSTLNGWNTLPSAYYYIESSNGFTIKGGGFGHGVGLSQNGANDMAKLGYLATDIISHYYIGVELKDMYSMMGE